MKTLLPVLAVLGAALAHQAQARAIVPLEERLAMTHALMTSGPERLVLAAATAATEAEPEAQALAPAGDPETARVISVVSSIPLAVDLAAYDLAEAAFAPEVVIDDTSLWGGEPQAMTPGALMDAWRGIVAGFDATWHQLSDVQATVSGDTATATAFVDGRHWIGEELWRPVGHYRWDLARLDGEWRVTRMAFAMTEEIGDRALAARAMERAAALSQQGTPER